MRDIWDSRESSPTKEFSILMVDYLFPSNLLIANIEFRTASILATFIALLNVLLSLSMFIRSLGINNSLFLRVVSFIHRKPLFFTLYILGPTMVDFLVKTNICERNIEGIYLSKYFKDYQCYSSTRSVLSVVIIYIGALSLMLNVCFSLYFSFENNVHSSDSEQRRSYLPEIVLFFSLSILHALGELGGKDFSIPLAILIIIILTFVLNQMMGSYHIRIHTERKFAYFGIASGLWISIGFLASSILYRTAIYKNYFQYLNQL